MTTDAANRTAVDRMLASRPQLVSVARAGDVVPGLAGRMLLHAGPPITWERASGPLRGALVGALVYEGPAASVTRPTGRTKRGVIPRARDDRKPALLEERFHPCAGARRRGAARPRRT